MLEVQVLEIKTEKALEVLSSKGKSLRKGQRGLSHLREDEENLYKRKDN